MKSGLNIFINDVNRFNCRTATASPALPTQELERLHDLLVRGAISQDEFDGLKAKLLGVAPSRETRQ